MSNIYGTETRALNQSVRRKIRRFPEDFMFQLTSEEWKNMSSQFVMTSRSKRPKSALPLVFTIHGAVQLPNVLQSDRAIETSILVVRAFNTMGEVLLSLPVTTEEIKEMQSELNRLKQYIKEGFTDYNDINEDTRAQLESINQRLSVANVQFSEIYQALIGMVEHKKELDKPRNPIGFMQPKNDN